jgi:tetratricopeptide (TPR) repeat protein
MGIVYRGYDPVIDRAVAVKTVLLPQTLSHPQRKAFLERFLLEARIAGKLLHPNIVVTYDAATDAETKIPYIAMELIEGESLHQRVARKKRLPWKEAEDIVIPIARALDYAHENGIIHRDIKPANVLLTESGEPKITDFGIAKMPTADLTQTGVIMGTPYFMSPEQLEGEKLDGRSDLFSLGAMLYRLIVGRPPFAAEDLKSISHQILYKDPKPPSEVVPKIPKSLDGVLARALAKAPADRYPSGEAFAEDLLAIRRGEDPRMALAPGEMTQAQRQETRADAGAPRTPPQETAVSVLESLEEAPSPGRRMGWKVVPLLLCALLLYAVFWGSDQASLRVQGWVREITAALNEAYRENKAKQERVQELRANAEEMLENGAELERRGHWEQARVAYRQGLELFRQAEDGVGEASVLLARGRLEARAGDWSQARSDLESARAVYRIYDDPAGQARALVLLGNLQRDRGGDARARALYEQALELAVKLEDDSVLREAQLNAAIHDLLRGRWESAREGLDAVRRDAEAGNHSELAASAILSLGALSYAMGNLEMVRTWWEEIRSGCRKSANPDCLSELELWEGRAALGELAFQAARSRFAEAERHFRRVKHLPGLAAALENRAELALREANESEASEVMKELASIRAELGLPQAAVPDLDSQTPEVDEDRQDKRLWRFRFIQQAVPRTPLSEERLRRLEVTFEDG